MGGVVLLTGATGFLGSRIAKRILTDTDCRIVTLVRAENDAEALLRLKRSWYGGGVALEGWENRVTVLAGDLEHPGLGVDPGVYAELAGTLTRIVHAAADLRLDGPIDELRRTNVDGTAHILAIARAAHRDHGLEGFSHVSTAYVAGARTGEVPEDGLCGESGFSNAYEQSKYEGELLVREAMKELPVTILRPGMVVGDSITGEIMCFNTIYVPLKLYLTGKLAVIPARPGLRVNMVPVDYVTDAVFRLSFDPRASGLTFHLTVDPELLPTAGELLALSAEWALKRLSVELPQPRFIPLDRLMRSSGGRIPGVPRFLLTYFNENRRFRRDNTDRFLGPWAPDWKAVLPRLMDYAVSRGFLHRSERTVHEQILRRLQSGRLPVRLHDIVEGRCTGRSGSEAAREIVTVTRALEALGIGRGDRVALVGLNSSGYLVLDVAIGLRGAVSVPLYYTSPVTEIGEILASCGARVLLVGAPAILGKIGSLAADVKIVSFCREPVPAGLRDRVTGWEAFLGKGDSLCAREADVAEGAAANDAPPDNAQTGERISFRAPVLFDELATLRYTSGTTGRPKGTRFTHAQLVWMAETLASLLPWKARTKPARYLSFLPMNHVVEGILGAYAPYSVPAPVDIYFLEDFHSLPRALSRVRPTIFFSVPRFYEKVWDRFLESLPGRLYRALPAGLIRRSITPLVRAGLLGKAGLSRCTQLIAGSAPSSETLLASFRELGIEIHNAYGLTEAPLLTLNRAGENRIPTVGTPLPSTEISIAHDGEVLVRGPQVTGGYYDETCESPLRGGWLHTGDLGRLDPDGSLCIIGRKKDVLVTSYGKNIIPSRIEELLRNLADVDEAMVVGDGRPYIGALIWCSGTGSRDGGNSGTWEALDEAIRRMNRGLSGPEGVKRWVVLSRKPGLEEGELTGNLKLRRHVVLEHWKESVARLYVGSAATAAPTEDTPDPEILHYGFDSGGEKVMDDSADTPGLKENPIRSGGGNRCA